MLTFSATASSAASGFVVRQRGWALPALLAAFLVSCGSGTSTGAAGKGQLTMKVNGVSWVAAGKVIGAASKGVIAVTGNLDSAGSEQLTFNIYQTATGTYVVDKASAAKDGSILTFNKTTEFYSSDIKTSQFTVVITKASGLVVEGTFTGTFEEGQASAGSSLPPKLVITEGKFATVE